MRTLKEKYELFSSSELYDALRNQKICNAHLKHGGANEDMITTLRLNEQFIQTRVFKIFRSPEISQDEEDIYIEWQQTVGLLFH